MKQLILVSALFILVSLSCAKTESSGCTPVTVATEKNTLVSYCTSSSITYTEHNSGILYEIINPGTGIAPTVSNKVYITYTGKRFDGTVFDSQSNPSLTGWQLNQLIDGWKIGLPLIKKGGRIKLVIPSSLAYGCSGAGASIPSNTPLYFDITLVDVQ